MVHLNAEASTSRVKLDDARAPKVAQVDSDELDEGLVQMLGERLERAVGNFKADWKTSLRPEVALVLKLVVFRYSFFGSTTASPGSRLQNLKLVGPESRKPSRRRLLLFLLLHPPIFPTYILIRLREHGLSNQWPDAPAGSWGRIAWKAITRLEDFARAWELGGWLTLLWDGRYPSLLMRLLQLRLVPASPHLTKLVSYEFMNRQLVWNAFTEFAMFAYPLLPPLPASMRPAAVLAPIRAALSIPKNIDYDSIPAVPEMSNGKTSKASHSGPLADLSPNTCPICHLRSVNTPIPLAAGISLPPVATQLDGSPNVEDDENRVFVPAQTDCWGGCRWCYYCIMGELASLKDVNSKRGDLKPAGEGKKWDCLRCGGAVTKAWRVGSEPSPLVGEDIQPNGDEGEVTS